MFGSVEFDAQIFSQRCRFLRGESVCDEGPEACMEEVIEEVSMEGRGEVCDLDGNIRIENLFPSNPFGPAL